MSLDDKPWFQVITRCWRPFQKWGIAIASVVYSGRAVIGMDFDVLIFTALAGFGTANIAIRGVEKYKERQDQR